MLKVANADVLVAVPNKEPPTIRLQFEVGSNPVQQCSMFVERTVC